MKFWHVLAFILVANGFLLYPFVMCECPDEKSSILSLYCTIYPGIFVLETVIGYLGWNSPHKGTMA